MKWAGSRAKRLPLLMWWGENGLHRPANGIAKWPLKAPSRLLSRNNQNGQPGQSSQRGHFSLGLISCRYQLVVDFLPITSNQFARHSSPSIRETDSGIGFWVRMSPAELPSGLSVRFLSLSTKMMKDSYSFQSLYLGCATSLRLVTLPSFLTFYFLWCYRW